MLLFDGIYLGAWKNSMFWSALAGLVLGMNTSAAHNFFHQADSWRMYYWDLSVLSSRDWRISHMLSHHLHTNTLKDLEVSGIEPYVAFFFLEYQYYYDFLLKSI